jgi:predicted Zn-dependent peptidase
MNKSKSELSEEIENMGARYTAHSDREYTSYCMNVFGSDSHRALSLLGDIVSNSTHNSAELELVKDEISMEHEENHTRYKETTMENVHFNAFREHMMG